MPARVLIRARKLTGRFSAKPLCQAARKPSWSSGCPAASVFQSLACPACQANPVADIEQPAVRTAAPDHTVREPAERLREGPALLRPFPLDLLFGAIDQDAMDGHQVAASSRRILSSMAGSLRAGIVPGRSRESTSKLSNVNPVFGDWFCVGAIAHVFIRRIPMHRNIRFDTKRTTDV